MLAKARADLAEAQRILYEDPPSVGLIVAAIATVVDSVTRVMSGIKALQSSQDAYAVVGGLLYHSKEIRGVMERLNPVMGNHLGEHLGGIGEMMARLGEVHLNDLAKTALEGHGDVADATELASLKRAAADVATRKVHVEADLDAHAGIMDRLARHGETLLTDSVSGLMSLYTEKLQARRADVHENVNEVAADMISTALKFGLTAQVSALALEALYFTKYTGVNQLVGYISNFAGFDRITGPVIDPQLEWGLARPAEHQAAKLYRTRLPSGEDAHVQAFRRHISDVDYRHALQLEGFPEDWIDVLVADRFIKPRPREILLMIDGIDVDQPWLATKYREHGWNDADVARAVAAAVRKAQKPASTRAMNQTAASYLKGWRTEEQLRASIGNVSSDETYITLTVQSYQEERAQRKAEELAKAVLDQYLNDIIVAETAGEMLKSLGFLEGERNHRLALTALKRNERLIKKETGDLEKMMTEVRGQSLATLRAELKDRELTSDDFVTLGLMLGYQEAWLTAVAELELEKPAPRTVPDIATVGLAHLTEALTPTKAIPVGTDGKPLPAYAGLESAALKNLRAQLHAGLLSRADFLSLGQMLGVAELTLEQLADAELIHQTAATEASKGTDPEAMADAAAAALTDLAARLVETKKVSGLRAVELLVAAGVPLSPAQTAIAIAEVLSGASGQGPTWPFATLENDRLVWTSVLKSVAKTLGGEIGDKTFIGKLLEGLGGANLDDARLRGVFDKLIGVFGLRPTRGREHVAVARPKSPTPIPPPLEEQSPQEQEYIERMLLNAEISSLYQQLSACSNLAVEKGLEPAPLPEVVPHFDTPTPLDELGAYANRLRLLLNACQQATGTTPTGAPPAPEPGQPVTPRPGQPPPAATAPPPSSVRSYLVDQSWRDDAAVQRALGQYGILATAVPEHFNNVLGRDPTAAEMVTWIPVGARTTWADFDAQLAAALAPPPPPPPPTTPPKPVT